MPSIIDQLGLRDVDPRWRFVEIVGGRRLTYGELFGETARLANALTGFGVQRGDRVAVQVEKSVEAVLLYLACARAGAVFLPLNTAYTLAELEYFIGDAEPALIVATPDRLDPIAGLAQLLGVAR